MSASGSTVALHCSTCGVAVAPGSRFCAACGATVPSADTPVPAAGAFDEAWSPIVERLRSATAGEFRIIRQIGRGGMAAVFLAHEVALNRRVAIKVMSPALLLADGMLDRFRNEAIAVAKMTHPNIVTVHAVRHVGDLHFFVMQLITGRPLDYVLEHHGPLPVELVRSIVFQVGSALTYAHRQGVVHRDIKPANLLLDGDGNAVVTDFGIAKMAEAPGYTQTGMTIGTPTYMSPEQYLGGEVGWSSDQYSLGVVVYEMLTGAPPYTGTAMTIMQGHLQGELPPIPRVRPDCPPDVADAVARMMAKAPERRWPSMTAALRALGAFLPPDGDPIRDEIARLATPDPSLLALPNDESRQSPLPEWHAAGLAAATVAATIDVATVSETIAVGETIQLGADARDGHGSPVRPIAWSVNNPAVAAIDDEGRLTGLAPGPVAVTASALGVSSTAQIRVLPAPVVAPPATVAPLATTADGPDFVPVNASALFGRSPPGAALSDQPTVVAPLPRAGAAADPVRTETHAEPATPDGHAAGPVRRVRLGALVALSVLAVAGVAWVAGIRTQSPPDAAMTAGAGAIADPAIGGVPPVDAADPEQPGRSPDAPRADDAQVSASSAGAPGRASPAAPGSPAAAPSPQAAARSPSETLDSEARSLIQSFARALATGNAAGVRRIYPGMRGDEPWWQFASARSGVGLRLTFFDVQAGSPSLTGDAAAEAIFETTYSYRDGAEEARQWFMFRALLSFDGTRWRIAEVRYY
jgi:eukaryotic-like serine/threonine-protein kinase